MKNISALHRPIALLLAAAAAFSLCACSSAPSETEAAPEPIPSAASAPEETVLPEEAVPTAPLPDIDITSWEFILANSYNSITEYEPEYGGFSGQGLDNRIVEAASAFLQAARDEGYKVYLAVGYRNYEYLLNYYDRAVRHLGGSEEAAKVALGPGVNEHQTGLAIDITDDIDFAPYYNDFENQDIEDTEVYQWMYEHCQEYGFIARYPEGKEGFYGTPCRCGHFRYVGVEAAAYIMENNLCLEEFLLLYDENAAFVPNMAK